MKRSTKEPRKYGPKSERIPAWVGWVGLVAYVAAWDLCPWTRTLSSGYAPDNTHGRKPANIAWLYLTGHLTRTLPVKYDILRSPNSPLVRLQRKVTAI